MSINRDRHLATLRETETILGDRLAVLERQERACEAGLGLQRVKSRGDTEAERARNLEGLRDHYARGAELVAEQIAVREELIEISADLGKERLAAARRALESARLSAKLGERKEALQALADALTLCSAYKDDDEAIIAALRRWPKPAGARRAA